MLVNNDSCSGTPEKNLQYESTSCYDAVGRDLKSALNIGRSGIGVFNGKFNDMIGLRNLDNGDPSMLLTHNVLNRTVDFSVAISATPGNTITLNPDGLYSAGGGGGSVDILSPLLLMGG